MLLKRHQINLKPKELLKLHFVGLFFNIALPGAVSGDVIKAMAVGKFSPGHRSAVFGSILMDRILGVSAMFMISVLSLFTHYDEYAQNGMLSGLKNFILIAGVAIITFYIYLFTVSESKDIILYFLKCLRSRPHKGHSALHSIERIYLGIKTYKHHPKMVASALLLSIIVQYLSCIACYYFLKALDAETVLLSKLVTVTPMGFLVTAIPVLPGGVGTGHAAFSFFYRLIGTERGADVFNFVVANTLLLGIVGSIIYLTHSSEYQAKTTQEELS
jgi:uncharacterized protein (TIRG00374 family)